MRKRFTLYCCGILAFLLLFCVLPCPALAAENEDASITPEQLEAFIQAAEDIDAKWDGKTPKEDGITPKWASGQWCASFVRKCLADAKIGNYSSNGAGDLSREIGEESASAIYYTASKNEAGLCSRYQLVDMDAYIPMPGDIIVYKRNDNNISATHTGIVVAYNSATNKITTIEGNTGHGDGKMKKRTVKLRTRLPKIGRISSYVRYTVKSSTETDAVLDQSVSLTSTEMHAVEALTSFAYGSDFCQWDSPEPLYFQVMDGLQALFFYESDFIGATADRDIDGDGYLWGLSITEPELSRFVSSIIGYELPASFSDGIADEDNGYIYSDGMFEFFLTDYNTVPYIISIETDGDDGLIVNAIMRNQLDCTGAPSQEELQSAQQFEIILRRNSDSPYGFTLVWQSLY